ncbi:elongation factor G [Prosthecobacter vanneervenii]|uniref:Elongation factor G n=1 Tax=Prosthecobacter vanneervenii TaxID=48466 RepID=A0A7W7Y775_9BACT|nr:elongation factor G [Prosthecobacter vanneervenii]MBB5030894.1 elongation factor G [Prosthecobacter vanneervenii]
MKLNTTDTGRIRNIGIAAHIDAGKTTLTERILFYAGAIHACGDVHEGNTATDFSDIEREKGITISSAAAPCEWTQQPVSGLTRLHSGQPHRLNIIDTPGHVDFTAEVERSLRVLDGAVAVFCGVGGVQPQSETVWRQTDRYRVPRVAFINKMDRQGADFARVVGELRSKLGANAWPVLLPWGAESGLCGQIDIIDERALRPNAESPTGFIVEDIPAEWCSALETARRELIEALASLDDEIAALWIEGQPVPAQVLRAAVRRQTIACRFVPVIGGSAYKHIGVSALVDAIVDFLPAPSEVQRAEVAEMPLAALAFKVVRHPQAGRLVYVRVYAGTLQKGVPLLNPRLGKTERCGRLLRVFADRRDELESVQAGDICVVTGLRDFSTGDTLCLEGHALMLEPPVFPEPVVSMAIEPAKSSDQSRLSTALARLADEDPTFRVRTHEETGQCLISGMGELHLEVIREKLLREHGVETIAGAPEIACRETITQEAEADHLLKKQNGGSGMYARVKLSVQPLERGAGIVIEDAIIGGSIPSQFLGAVRRGITEAALAGPLAGSPLVDMRVRIIDGALHAKDSNDQAFRMAAAVALHEAVRHAAPVLLEPVMLVECTVSGEHQGDILGDLNRRRARVMNIDHRGHEAGILAEVPLLEMFGYAGAIRSLSRGRASYTMVPTSYEVVPESVLKRLVEG